MLIYYFLSDYRGFKVRATGRLSFSESTFTGMTHPVSASVISLDKIDHYNDLSKYLHGS